MCVPQKEHHMCAPASRSISLRAEEIEQRFRNGIQCAKNAYATTDDSRLVFGPGGALIRGLTTVSIS